MKKIRQIGAAFLVSLLLSGCGADSSRTAGTVTPPPALTDTTDRQFSKRTALARAVDFHEKDGLTLAVAYLGRGRATAEKTLNQMAGQYSPDGKNLLEGLETVDCGGEAYYLVIPRFSDMEVRVQTLSPGSRQVEKTRVLGSAAGFLLCSGSQEGEPAGQIVAARSGWRGVYAPAVTGPAGRLQVGEFVFDITDYAAFPPEAWEAARRA